MKNLKYINKRNKISQYIVIMGNLLMKEQHKQEDLLMHRLSILIREK
jgi:hypothetical protein